MNGIEAALVGRVSSEPELKSSSAGKPWLRLNVAVGYADNVQWAQVACFGELAERIAGSVRKGDRIYCEGSLRLNSWIAHDGAQRSGLSVAAWRCERLGEIGKNKPKRSKPPPEGHHPVAPSANGAHRPASPRLAEAGR